MGLLFVLPSFSSFFPGSACAVVDALTVEGISLQILVWEQVLESVLGFVCIFAGKESAHDVDKRVLI